MKPKIYSSTFRYENIHDRDQGGGGVLKKVLYGEGRLCSEVQPP